MKWVALLMVPAAACGSVGGNDKMDARLIDSPRPIDAAPDAVARRCDPTKPFGTPVALDELNTVSQDLAPSLSPDELTVYLFSDRGGAGTLGGFDFFVATRSSLTAPFGTPAVLAGVNTSGDDECASVTGDGLFLYVDRFSSAANWDIYVAQRANTTVDFGTPTAVTSLNQAGAIGDENQFVLPDNSAMYFISTRGSSLDIYRAARNVGGTFDAAVDVLPTTDSEVTMAVTSDELTMLFSSDKTPSTGSYDIWMTKRATKADGWGTPVHVDELSTAGNDSVTWISADGCDAYVTHDVSGRGNDIFWARRPM